MTALNNSIDTGGADGLVLFSPKSTSQTSPLLQIEATPYVVKAYGLTGDQSIAIENIYAALGLSAPYCREGAAVVLTPTANSAVLYMTGFYQFVFAGALGSLTVTATPQTTFQLGDGSATPASASIYLGAGMTLSANVQVGARPWVFRAYGLSGNQTVQVLQVYGSTASPWSVGGITKTLTATSNEITLDLSGTYAFSVPSPISGLVVAGNETVPMFLDPYVLEDTQNAAGQAAASAATASTAATTATTQAGIATTQATDAAASAATASTAATTATTQAGIATTQATDAAASAATASTEATTATTQAGIATTQATDAAASAATASTAATTATTQAGIATTQATDAAASAATASTEATTATTQAGIATTQATDAAASAATASTEATTATTQAGIATTQATNASTSATNAATSASAASASASTAASSASGAASSASGASASAAAAATSATNAAASSANPQNLSQASLSSSSGVITISCANPVREYVCVLNQNVTSWAFTNLPSAGTVTRFRVLLTQGTSAFTCAAPAPGKTAGGAWTVSATVNSVQPLDMEVNSSGIAYMIPFAVLS